MKKIETFIFVILTALFFYSFIELLFAVAGCLENSPTSFIPFRINGQTVVAGLLISGLAVIFFPIWNVGKYFKLENVKQIMDFKRDYKVDYVFLFIGFLGLACWCGSGRLFDVFFSFGLVFIILYFSWIVIPLLATRGRSH